MKSLDIPPVGVRRHLLISTMAPMIVVLAALTLPGGNPAINFAFLLGVVGVMSPVFGFWLAFRGYRRASDRLVGGFLFTGLIAVINSFIIFVGCMAPDSGNIQWRRNAASARELEKVGKSIPPRSPQAGSEMLDLTPHFNAALTEDWYTQHSYRNLAALPLGIQDFAQAEFEIRGVIRTCSHTRRDDGRKYPPQVNAIKIGRRCQRIQFLHGSGWSAPDQTNIGTFWVHYADGQNAQVPIVYGRDVLQSWFVEGAQNDALERDFLSNGGTIAWKESQTKSNEKTKARLFLTTWENPRPDATISQLDLAANSKIFATPFLVAISVK